MSAEDADPLLEALTQLIRLVAARAAANPFAVLSFVSDQDEAAAAWQLKEELMKLVASTHAATSTSSAIAPASATPQAEARNAMAMSDAPGGAA